MKKASDLFIECLADERVEYIFGVPGEENLDFLDSLSRPQSIKLILTPPAQGPGFMAPTYAPHTAHPRLRLPPPPPPAPNSVTPATHPPPRPLPQLTPTPCT